MFTYIYTRLLVFTYIYTFSMFTPVYLFARVNLCLPRFTLACLHVFNHVYSRLHLFSYVYHVYFLSPMFALVYLCLSLFTCACLAAFSPCLLVFTCLFGLPMFSTVYSCMFTDIYQSLHLFPYVYPTFTRVYLC